MPSGRLGASDLTAATNTTLYASEVGKYAVVTVSLCNRSADGVQVRLAVSTSATPSNSEYIEFNSVIPPYGVLERTGIVVSNTQQIVAWSNVATVSAVAYGLITAL